MDLIFKDEFVVRPIAGKHRLAKASTTTEMEKLIDERYDLVFRGELGSRLYVGPCGAFKETRARLRVHKKPSVLLKIEDLDYRRDSNVKPKIPKGMGPLFIDLQQLHEGIDTVQRYMKPLLDRHARVVASQLHEGRWIFIDCKLGQNRSAMFTVAVLVAYRRLYPRNEEGKTDIIYSASDALKELRKYRKELAPQPWVWDGFRAMEYEPKKGDFRRAVRERSHPKKLYGHVYT